MDHWIQWPLPPWYLGHFICIPNERYQLFKVSKGVQASCEFQLLEEIHSNENSLRL